MDGDTCAAPHEPDATAHDLRDEPGWSGRDRSGVLAAELAGAGLVEAVEIGRGGFGVVYRCRQVDPDRVVAVKVLTGELGDDRARFAREQQVMARLTGHPHIVAVLQVGHTESRSPFLVMPMCRKGSLHARIAQLGSLPVDEVLRVGVKIAGALAAAHRLGIVHRDVKPDNILLTDYGEPALGDFGIARTAGEFKTATGLLVGSPAYTAPEVLQRQPSSAASDVYGLGGTLFAGLSGHAAFERRAGEAVFDYLMRITSEPVPDLGAYGIPDDVVAVVNAAMARRPEDRPTARELGELIQRVQANRGLPTDEMILHDSERSRQPMETPAAVPPGKAAGMRGNLPTTLNAPVGRDRELEQLAGLLENARLVSLTGIGGIGKTTLATYAAHRLRHEFPDGVWLVELAELRDASLVAHVIIAAVGLRDQPGRTPTEVLVSFLASRRALLVLDNCEHLIDEVAKLTETLLHNCPHLQILATSRELLDIAGEAILTLGTLASPDISGDPTLSSLAGYDAVALFVQRAHAALPEFALTEANAAAVAQICTRLDGLPLAIELAAARLRALSAEQIAEGLCDRFALLKRGRRGAPDRQQTLAGCIQWSYGLCTATEQQLWARLSVFAGSFDLPAVQYVCAEDLDPAESLDVLTALVDKSILIRTHLDNGVMQFRLLDTVREYGSARLGDTEVRRLRRRHTDWYRQLLAQAWAEWYGPRQVQWLHRLSAEMPNIREALKLCVSDSPVSALELAVHLGPFWQLRGLFSEARRWLDLSLDATAPEPTPLRIRALYYAVMITFAQGDLPAARTRITQGRNVLAGINDPYLHALIDCADGGLAMFSGELGRSRDCYRRALDNTNDYEVQTRSMYMTGLVLEFTGEHDEAMAWHEKALILADSREDPYLRASAQYCLGLCLWRRNEYPHAEDLLSESLRTLAALDETWVSVHCLEALSWIAGSSKRSRQAMVLMAAAHTLSETSGMDLFPLPDMATWHDQCHRTAREQLSADEFQTAWAQGNALSLKDAAAFALTATAST